MPDVFDQATARSDIFDTVEGAGDIFDQAESPGTLQGIVNSAKRGFLAGGRAIDLAAATFDENKGPTFAQGRRAFERAMRDPRYMQGLIEAGDDPEQMAKVDALFGPPAKLDQLRTREMAGREARYQDIAAATEKISKIPQSEAMRRWSAADNTNWFKVFASDPVEITANIFAESVPQSAVAMGAGMAGGSAAGPVGSAVGAGAGSFAVEAANAIGDAAQQAGYDLGDADQVRKFFESPEALGKAKVYAVKRGLPIAAFDALTAGVAGRFLKPMLGKGLGKAALGTVAELGTQMAGGAAGEASAQLVTGQPFSWKDIAAEAIGELASAPSEIVTNLREELQHRKARTQNEIEKTENLKPGDVLPGTESLNEFGGEVIEDAAEAVAPVQRAGLQSAPPELQQPGLLAPPAEGGGEQRTVSDIADKQSHPVIEIPLEQLSLSEDVPNFKADADEQSGVVQGQQLEGKYQRLGTGAITVWERSDGRKEVISGRHRFDLAKRAGETTIPAQVVREADGFTAPMAMTLDAEMNIRDGQGSVGDYATYFRNTEFSEQEAAQRGLLARAKGQAGWALGRNATDDLFSLYRAGKVSEPQAVAIAQAAPGEAALQRVGSRAALRGLTPVELGNFVQAVRYKTKNLPAEQLDLFGADDTALNEAEKLAKTATQFQRELEKEIKSTDNAARNVEAAKKKGVVFTSDPEKIIIDNVWLRIERNRWNNWALHPDLVAKVTGQEQTSAAPVEQSKPSTPAAPAAQPDAFEQLLNQAIAATDLKPGQTQEGVTGAPVWLTKAAANGVLRVVRAAYRGGRTLAQAIRDGVEWLRAQNLEGYHEAEASAWLESAVPAEPADPQRQYGEKVRASEAVPAAVQAAVTEYSYRPRTNEGDRETAGRIIAERGVDNAIAAYKDERNDIPGAVRSILGDVLTEQLARAQQLAELGGNRIASEELTTKMVDLIDHELRRSTEIAQNLQAMRRYGLMSTAGLVRHARNTIEDAGRTTLEPVKPVVDAVADTLRNVNETVIDATAADPGVQRTAREAVNDLVKDAPATQKAVLAEATNNVELLPQFRKAAQDAAIKALQKQGGGVGYWQSVVNQSSNSLVKALEAALQGPKRKAETVSALAARLTQVLREQMNTALNMAKDAPLKPDHFQRMRDLLGNSERMSQIWGETRDRLAAEHPDDPQVAALLAKPFDVWSKPLLRSLLNQYLAEAGVNLREIVAGHYRLANDGRVLRDKLVERLGLNPDEAQRLARDIEDMIKHEGAKIRNDLDNRIQRVRTWRDDRLLRIVKSGEVSMDQVPGGEVERVIRAQLREANLKLGEIIRRAKTELDATGRSLGQRVVDELGMPGTVESKKKLQEAFDRRFNALATAAKKKALEQLGKTVDVPRKVKELYQKLIEATNLGAFDNETLYNLIRAKYDLPAWTPELAADITKQAALIQTKPEGFQRQRAVVEMLNRIERVKGMRWWEMPMAFWYAHILSGPFTHVKNVLGNIYNLGAFTTLQMARRPQDTFRLLADLGRGAVKGAGEGAAVLQTGVVTGTRLDKFTASRALELKRLPGRWDYLLTPWRAVGRALAAEDMLFFKAAEEMRAGVASRVIARKEGLSGDALRARTAELMGHGEARRLAAQTQAHAEGLTGLDAKRRVHEILEQQRPENIREQARAYALRATFNQTPEGVLGVLTQHFNAASEKIPTLKLVAPFTNIIANVVNESLYYVPPVGAYRAWKGYGSGEMMGRPVEQGEVFDTTAKAVAGTAALLGLAALAAKHWDDDDPAFAIYGAGPRTKEQRDQLKETGWRPYTIKIRGKYYNYQQTPLAIPVSWLGHYLDAKRWKHIDEADALQKVAVAGLLFGRTITDQSWLDGVAGVFQAYDRDPGKNAGQASLGQLTRTASGFVIPNAVKQIDQLFDPAVYDSQGIRSLLYSQVPVARRLNKPALNVLGEPVTSERLRQFVSAQKTDPLWTTIANRQLFVSVPSKTTMLGDRVITPDEYYELNRIRGQWLGEQLRKENVLGYLQTLPREQAQKMLDLFETDATTYAKAKVRMAAQK
jgi:hypothetical protein